MTPIKNKVSEVIGWIDAHGKSYPPPEKVKDYIDRRWPDLLPEIRETIFVVTLGQTF